MNGHGRRLLPLLAAAGIVAAAVYAAGSIGSSPPATTTTTTLGVSIADEALSGPALSWRRIEGDPLPGYPVVFDSMGDEYVVFAITGSFLDRRPPLSGWRSRDLVTWTAIDLDPLPESTWTNVVVADEGIVALTQSSTGSTSVWVSSDGSEWTELVLPVLAEGGTTYAVGALWFEGDLLVQAVTDVDTAREVLAALPEELRDGIENGSLAYSDYGDAVVVTGPMDVVVYRGGYEQLGLEPPPPAGDPRSLLWIRGDDDWETVELTDEGHVDQIVPGPGGGLVAGGWRDTGGGFLLTSEDGRAWREAASTFSAMDLAAVWGDLLISRSGLPGLRASTDGEEWTEITPRGMLRGGLSWGIERVAAGDLGLLATAFGSDPGDQDYVQPPPLVIAKDGYRIERSWDSGRITVTDHDGTVVSTAESWTDRPDPSVAFDPASGAITFLDPGDGAEIVSLTPEEWQTALAEQPFPFAERAGEPALVFTTDGERWSVATPEWMTDFPYYGLGPMLVEDDRALTTAAEIDDDGSTASFTFWEGTLP